MAQVYFENIEECIYRNIVSAEKRIYVAVAWFTNQVLFNGLICALEKNVEVKVIVLNDLINRNEFGLDFGIANVLNIFSIMFGVHKTFC